MPKSKDKDLFERYEKFGFALCGVIGNLYEYLVNEEKFGVSASVAKAYCEAVDAMSNEGATSIGYGTKKYNMEELEDYANELKSKFLFNYCE